MLIKKLYRKDIISIIINDELLKEYLTLTTKFNKKKAIDENVYIISYHSQIFPGKN